MVKTSPNPWQTLIESFPGFAKMKTDEQKSIKTESLNVIKNLEISGHSDSAIGESLRKIRTILDPYRMFVAYVDHTFHMSRATAYRYMGQAEQITSNLPAKVAELALIRGTKITPDLIIANPPPQTENLDEALKYLESIEAKAPRNTTVNLDWDVLLKESLNYVMTRRNRVQGDDKARIKWEHEFISMLMTKFGYTDVISFKPMKVPDKLIPKRGRPALVVAA